MGNPEIGKVLKAAAAQDSQIPAGWAEEEEKCVCMQKFLNDLVEVSNKFCNLKDVKNDSFLRSRQCDALVKEMMKIIGHHGAIDKVEGNPLLSFHKWLRPKVPCVLQKLWQSLEDITDLEQGYLQLLSGKTLDFNEGLEMFSLEHGKFRSSTAHNFFNLVQQPWAQSMSFGIPSEEALVRIAGYAPIVEMGCGSGYWSALLRQKGVPVVAIDLKPPQRGAIAEESHLTSYYFTRAFTDIIQGDTTLLNKYSDHTLLLVWPSGDAEEQKSDSSVEWDKECLLAYDGDTVIHVGEWHNSTVAVKEGGLTSSVAFQELMETTFECIERIMIPTWMWNRDALTIWKRK